jgi:diacylglycerol kinase family enzyme
MRATVLHNPNAGDGNLSADELVAALREAGLAPAYHALPETKLEEALRKPADLVVVAGGDGTVARVLKRLPNREVPVGVVPLGTANNIARSLGIEGAPHDLMAGWRDAARRRVEVGMARGPWGSLRFVEGVGFGALADAAAKADALPKAASDRKRHSRDNLRKVLAEAGPVELRVALDGRDVPGPLLLAEALNIGFVGPSVLLAPQADPGDGRLDLVGVAPARRGEMLAWLDEQPDGPPPATLLQGCRVRVAWRGAALHLDDEFPDHAEGECEMELEPEPLTILVPARGGRSR